MKTNSALGLPRWITADGELNLAEMPIDGILKQTIDLADFERFRSGCTISAAWLAEERANRKPDNTKAAVFMDL